MCALPPAYRTTKTEPVVFDLTDKCCADNNPVYPHGVDAFYFSEVEIAKFTKRCVELGLQHIGIKLCCGNTGNYTRGMVETLAGSLPLSMYIASYTCHRMRFFYHPPLSTHIPPPHIYTHMHTGIVYTTERMAEGMGMY